MAGADRRSKWKFPLVFIGSLLSLAILFQLVEMLLPEKAGEAARPSGAGGASTTPVEVEAEVGATGAIRPVLTRDDPQTIVIDLGFMRSSRFQFSGDESAQADAFAACLEREFAATFAAAEWDAADAGAAERSALRRRMKTVVREISDRCLASSLEAPPADS